MSLRATALAGLFLAAAAAAAAAVPPRPDRYATDRAGVVDAARLSALNERLAQFERETSNQVLVYVDRRVPADTTLEQFAADAFKSWGVGQKGKDNGAVFFVFVDDRKMRVEVGYGLEGALPDIRAASIIEDYAKPRFRSNDYAGGVDAVADQVMRAARGEPYQGSGRTQAESGLLMGDGPPPFWCWLPPLVALAIAAFAARSASGPDRWIRGGLVSGLVALPLSMVATVLVKDGRLIAIGLAFLLLSFVPVLWYASQKRAPVDGRREVGRQLAILAGCALQGAVGIAVLAAIWGARVPYIGYVILLSLAALPVAGLVYARDPAEVLTLVVGRLSAVVFIPSVLFSVFFVVLGASEMLPGLLDWVVPSGLLWLAATVFARARGWVIWPKGSGGSYSGSGYSSGSSWSSGGSSYSSSSSGSSFSGGGGSSGGGGASGSW
jgi:uncharacterized protein